MSEVNMTELESARAQWLDAAVELDLYGQAQLEDGTVIVPVDHWLTADVARINGQEMPTHLDDDKFSGYMAVSEFETNDEPLDLEKRYIIAVWSGGLSAHAAAYGDSAFQSRGLSGVVGQHRRRHGQALNFRSIVS